MTPEGAVEVSQDRKFTQSTCPDFRPPSPCKQELERPIKGLTLAATPQSRPPVGDICQNLWILEMSSRMPSRTQSESLPLRRKCLMAITYPTMQGFQLPNSATPTWKVLRVPGKPNCRWWYIIITCRLTNII